MRKLEWLAASMITLAAVAGGMMVGSYLDELRDGNGVSLQYEPPTLRLDDLQVDVRLGMSSQPDSPPYAGTGMPYAIVTLERSDGNVHAALLYAEITPKRVTGLDMCQTRFIFSDFFIVDPATGASEESTSVTYASESYVRYDESIPGGSQCAARLGVEGEWDVELCVEGDGHLELPRSTPDGHTVIDTYDFCHLLTHRGEVQYVDTPAFGLRLHELP